MRSTELNLGDFADSTQDGIIIKNDHRLVFINNSMEAMLGYAPGELADATIEDILDTNQIGQGSVDKCNASTTHIGRHETYFRHKDGGRCPVEVICIPGKWYGNPVLVLIVHDITERKCIEQALRDSETRFLQLTNNINAVFFVRDLRVNRMIYMSPAYEKIWQRPLSTIYENALSFMDHIHPEDKHRIQEIIRQRNVDRKGFSTYQYRIVLPDGGIRWIRSRTFPVTDESGRPYRVAGIAEDFTEQKEAEEKLRLNEIQLRQIIDLVPHFIFVKDRDGRFLLANKATAEFCGMTVDEITGKLQRDMNFNKDQVEYSLANDRLILNSTLDEWAQEEELVDATGNHRVLYTTKIPFVSSNNGEKAILGVSIDITDRNRTEAALQLSEERLRRSLNYANMGTWDWNIRTGTLYWTEQVAPLFGYKVGTLETSYDAFLAAIHPEDRHLVETAVTYCIDTGQDYDIEHRVIWGDDSVHWLHESGGVIYGANGKAERMLGVVREITRRKSVEQSLLESEAKYRVIMENASDAILLGTMDAWIIDANRRAEELFGYSRDELLTMHGTAIHPEEDHPNLTAAFNDLKTTGRSLYEHLVLRKDKTVINVEVAATVIDYQGNTMVMAIFRDITARKHAENERLTHTKVQRDTLVREVHHRIKNNLQGVAGLLRNHLTQKPELRTPLEAAISQVNSMAVVYGLYGKNHRQDIILCELVKAICLAAGDLTGQPIEPTVKITVEHPIRVNNEEAVPLALILNELIFNAIKHKATASAQVQVLVEDEQLEDIKGGARVRITTHGTHLPQGFDFEGGSGLGTGLGLVKSLIPTNGCRLRIDDEAEGVVTELHLSHPVLLPTPAPSNQP